MRLASLIALSAAAVTLTALASPADAQSRRVYRGQQTERITIIDENGRARTRVTVKPRSFLDGGTEVLPGDRKFQDYAFPSPFGYPSFARENRNRPIDRQPLQPQPNRIEVPRRLPIRQDDRRLDLGGLQRE